MKAEASYVKALHTIQKFRLSMDAYSKNQDLMSIQVSLMNFITSLESQHADIISNIVEDVLPDFQDNQTIQESYRDSYVLPIRCIHTRIMRCRRRQRKRLRCFNSTRKTWWRQLTVKDCSATSRR